MRSSRQCYGHVAQYTKCIKRTASSISRRGRSHLQMTLIGHGRTVAMVLLLEPVRQGAAHPSHETPHDLRHFALILIEESLALLWLGDD